MSTHDSPLVEDLEVRSQERRGGFYHRIVDSCPEIYNGAIYTEDGEYIQGLEGRRVKIESEKLTLYREKSEEQFTIYHVYVKDETVSP